MPQSDQSLPCVVVCPGGGYFKRSDHEGEPVARWLCSLGLAAAVLDYRVAPHRHPVPLGDAQRAIRLIRSQASAWHIDPQRVGILGFSAGGHLAASAATILDPVAAELDDLAESIPSRPDALIACYPVITFGQHRSRLSLGNLLGTEPDPALVEHLSLEDRVSPATPPTFLWHTADDRVVPVQNSLLFAQALAAHGLRFALHVFPQGKHGLGLATENPSVAQWTGLCHRWLTEIGFAPLAWNSTGGCPSRGSHPD